MIFKNHVLKKVLCRRIELENQKQGTFTGLPLGSKKTLRVSMSWKYELAQSGKCKWGADRSGNFHWRWRQVASLLTSPQLRLNSNHLEPGAGAGTPPLLHSPVRRAVEICSQSTVQTLLQCQTKPNPGAGKGIYLFLWVKQCNIL